MMPTSIKHDTTWVKILEMVGLGILVNCYLLQVLRNMELNMMEWYSSRRKTITVANWPQMHLP